MSEDRCHPFLLCYEPTGYDVAEQAETDLHLEIQSWKSQSWIKETLYKDHVREDPNIRTAYLFNLFLFTEFFLLLLSYSLYFFLFFWCPTILKNRWIQLMN